jgi:hypothetical protein
VALLKQRAPDLAVQQGPAGGTLRAARDAMLTDGAVKSAKAYPFVIGGRGDSGPDEVATSLGPNCFQGLVMAVTPPPFG